MANSFETSNSSILQSSSSDSISHSRKTNSLFPHRFVSIVVFISRIDRLGGVFLSVTGCEALYADLGKNGNNSQSNSTERIERRLSRTFRCLSSENKLVLFCLSIRCRQLSRSRSFSYSSSSSDRESVGNEIHSIFVSLITPIRFYRSLPSWSHWPMVILATIATSESIFFFFFFVDEN